MPLTKVQRAAYGPDWPAVSQAIRERAGGQCECRGECGRDHLSSRPAPIWTEPNRIRCWAVSGVRHPVTWSRVVLTVAHLDHNPGTDDPDRLRAMCQRCHLSYDRLERGSHV